VREANYANIILETSLVGERETKNKEKKRKTAVGRPFYLR
jgi:hypothetical protein